MDTHTGTERDGERVRHRETEPDRDRQRHRETNGWTERYKGIEKEIRTLQLNNKRANDSIQRWAKDLNRNFPNK